MGYPYTGFAGRAARVVVSTLAMAVIMTSSSVIAHDNTECIGCKSRYKTKDKRNNRDPKNLTVSKDFKFYNQVDSLDLADPKQAETLLRFMDIRLAEKKLDEEVVLVRDSGTEIKQPDKKTLTSVEKTKTPEKEGGDEPEKLAKPKMVNKKKAEDVASLKEQQKDNKKTVMNKKVPVKSTEVDKDKDKDKEKEPARIAKTMEGRKAGAQASEKKRQDKKQEQAQKSCGKTCPKAQQKKEDAARLAKQPVKPKAAVNILPDKNVAYQVAADKSPEIINFDQAITQRFKTAGSYLDRGEHGNNIVKDNQGREFLNVMAFWDVLVEPQDNGENHYYGSIQFPLGSRHPAIIKSTRPGDTLAMGCQSNEVVVLKGFETEGVDYQHGLIDAYLAHSAVMPDGTVALQEVVHQPSFSLINVETGCMPRDLFSRSEVDPERMGNDKALHALPVRE